MTQEDLLDLAGRVEAAVAYDGRMMAEIDCAINFPDLRPAEPDDHPTVKDRRFDPSSIWTPTGWLMSRDYWRSLNDATALMPEKSVYRSGHSALDQSGMFFCDVVTEDGRDFHALAKSEPAARTAAALRSRAALLAKGERG